MKQFSHTLKMMCLAMGLCLIFVTGAVAADPNVKITPREATGSSSFPIWTQNWECNVPWDDPGATAVNVDTGEDLSRLIKSEIDDPSNSKEFTVKYWVEIDGQKLGLVQRKVSVIDSLPPVINLLASQEGVSGVQLLTRDFDPKYEEPEWVTIMRNNLKGKDPVWDFLVVNPLFNYVPTGWADAGAMPWRCYHLNPYKEALRVFDACEGEYTEDTLDKNIFIIVTRVCDKGEEFFVTGGSLSDINNKNLIFSLSKDLACDNYVGYRFYYFAKDSGNRVSFISRHVRPVSGEGISLAEPKEITIRCNGNLNELRMAESRDTAASVCRGNITHLIRRSGEVPKENGFYVPGTYYLYYTIESYQSSLQLRKIIVEDTPPVIHLFNQKGDEVDQLSPESLIILPWCEFLSEEGTNDEEKVHNWEKNWWPMKSLYAPEEPEEYGFSVTHICEDNSLLSSWVDLKGIGIIRNTLLNTAAAGSVYDHVGLYPLTYELNYPSHKIVSKTRYVLITENLSVDLDFLGSGYTIEDGQELVRIECGSSTIFNPPEVVRVWSQCSNADLTAVYETTINAFKWEGSRWSPMELKEEPINTSEPGRYKFIYYAKYKSGEDIPIHTLKVLVEDTQGPIITLNEGEEFYIPCGSVFKEPGFNAMDQCDGDLTGQVRISGYPVTDREYRTYTVKDSSGYESSVRRKIVDLNLEITLNRVDKEEVDFQNNPVFITEWECNKPFVDPGVSEITTCTGEPIPMDGLKVSGLPAEDYKPVTGDEFLIVYEITYQGRYRSVERLVRVGNFEGPEISLQGEGVLSENELVAPDAPDPEWWTDAKQWCNELYGVDSVHPQLPTEWRVAEAYDELFDTAMPWNCPLSRSGEFYEEELGVRARDICDDKNVPWKRMLLLLTEYNAQDEKEYFRYAGFLDDFENNPPAHIFDRDVQEQEARHLRQDISGLTWMGYRAYYVAWDLYNNYSVASRLIKPEYVEFTVNAEEITVECGEEDQVDLEDNVQVQFLCEADTEEALQTYYSLWHLLEDGTWERDDSGALKEYTVEEAKGQPGEYAVLYSVVSSSGLTVPERDTEGNLLNVEALLGFDAPNLCRFLVQDTIGPVLTLLGDEVMEVNFGEGYEEPGYVAFDQCEGDLTAAVKVTGRIDTFKLGEQQLIYRVSDGTGNSTGIAKDANEVVRTVIVVDPSRPEITVDPLTVTVECNDVYTDTGITAVDLNTGTDMMEYLQVSGLSAALMSADGARPGVYEVTYRLAYREDRNEAVATRTIVVRDSVAPVISLRGPDYIEIDCGANYRDLGIMSASDSCDGDLTRSVRQQGNADSSTPGTYVLNYHVQDSAGNMGSVSRTVVVRPCSDEGEGEGEGEVPGEGEVFEGEDTAEVRVPALSMLSVEEAGEVLASRGLHLDTIQRICDDEIPEGIVISQDPAPGTLVERGTDVVLQVSCGPCPRGCEGGCDGGNIFGGSSLLLGIFATIAHIILSIGSGVSTGGTGK